MSGTGVQVVDARGLRCPLPVVRLAAAARDAPGGAVLEVWSTDPAAALDVPAWARMRGHTVVASTVVAPGAGSADAAPGEARPERDDAAHEWRIRVSLAP